MRRRSFESLTKPIRLAAIFAAAGILACAGGAQAQYKEGGYYLADRLNDLCRADSGPEADRCMTYIVGVADSVMYDWADTLCVPDKTTPAELKAVFMQHYVSDNGYHPAAVEIRSALQQKWPCKPASPAMGAPHG
jgi:hypothetical protein